MNTKHNGWATHETHCTNLWLKSMNPTAADRKNLEAFIRSAAPELEKGLFRDLLYSAIENIDFHEIEEADAIVTSLFS